LLTAEFWDTAEVAAEPAEAEGGATEGGPELGLIFAIGGAAIALILVGVLAFYRSRRRTVADQDPHEDGGAEMGIWSDTGLAELTFDESVQTISTVMSEFCTFDDVVTGDGLFVGRLMRPDFDEIRPATEFF
jgi:hypothetical protein